MHLKQYRTRPSDITKLFKGNLIISKSLDFQDIALQELIPAHPICSRQQMHLPIEEAFKKATLTVVRLEQQRQSVISTQVKIQRLESPQLGRNYL
jgi:hypothetical protein